MRGYGNSVAPLEVGATGFDAARAPPPGLNGTGIRLRAAPAFLEGGTTTPEATDCSSSFKKITAGGALPSGYKA
jgi:hypothetical protein